MKHVLVILFATLFVIGIIVACVSCSFGDMPEIEQQRLQLKRIEILTRYGGDKAALTWEGKWNILYYQQIDIDDTCYYHVGMYSICMVKK